MKTRNDSSESDSMVHALRAMFVHGIEIVISTLLMTYVVGAIAAPAYVADDGLTQGHIAIIDTGTTSVNSKAFAVPPGPIGVAASRDGKRIYVPIRHANGLNFGPGVLLAIDVDSGQLVGNVPIQGGNDVAVVSLDSRTIFTSNPTDDRGLRIVSAATLSVVADVDIGSDVHGVAISPDGKIAYAVTTQRLYVISVESKAVLASVAIGPVGNQAAISPDGSTVYVASSIPGTVTVFSTSTLTITKTIAVPDRAYAIAVSPNGARVYVVSDTSPTLSVIDTATNALVASIALPANASGVDTTPNGGRIYVTHAGTKSVTVVSASTNTIVATIGGLSGARSSGPFIGPEPGSAVEFYHPALNHYFITSNKTEMAGLDNAVHPGWVRTRQSFPIYASGDGNGQPTCRFYGAPSAGLDSHFYSASVSECADVAAKFPLAWIKESDNVFQIDLPNLATGACPAGTSPVYRLWNQRKDSNHRYTTDPIIRQRMIVEGFLPEGYGSDGIAMCAPGS